MRSYLLGLLASSVIGFTAAQDLLPCGNAFYVASQYTCFDGEKLCPVENGVPTQPCGEDCYLSSMYGCDNGRLTPPPPAPQGTLEGTFEVVALETPFFQSAFIQADGLIFNVGGNGPATYCPDQVAQLGACPPGTETVWTCSDEYCSLNVEVPGGQQIYVAPNGAVGYTQAHSAYAPPGSAFSGFSLSNGQLQFGGAGFLACPSADSSSTPQLYAVSQLTIDDNACYAVELVTATENSAGFAAWQYT